MTFKVVLDEILYRKAYLNVVLNRIKLCSIVVYTIVGDTLDLNHMQGFDWDEDIDNTLNCSLFIS